MMPSVDAIRTHSLIKKTDGHPRHAYNSTKRVECSNYVLGYYQSKYLI